MRWKLAALAMLAGCGRCTHASEGVADAGGADATVIDATPRDASTDARPHARVPTPEERKRYDDALGRARKATVAKNYAIAIAAFDEALTAIPNDARATSERGYARLLSGDDKRAEKDFNAAVDEVPKSDKKLTAQIYFNLGLVAEKRGEPAGAYFRSSYEYNPTAAAKAKMSACPVEVETAFDVLEDADGGQLEEARGGRQTEGTTSLFLDIGNGAFMVSSAAYLPKVHGGYAIVATGAKTTLTRPRWCCLEEALQDEVEIKREGSLWAITVQPMVAGITPCPCGTCKPGEIIANVYARLNGEGDGGETMKCEDSPFSNEVGNCIPCGGTIDVGVGNGPDLAAGGSREVFYVDATTGAALWHVTYDTSFADKITVVVEQERTLVVTGADCHVALPRP